MRAPEILKGAAAALDDRAKTRDVGAERSMARTVDMFNAMLGGDRRLTEAEGWIFMCCLKLARGAHKRTLDDALDLAGYAALWGETITSDEEKYDAVDADLAKKAEAMDAVEADARAKKKEAVVRAFEDILTPKPYGMHMHHPSCAKWTKVAYQCTCFLHTSLNIKRDP